MSDHKSQLPSSTATTRGGRQSKLPVLKTTITTRKTTPPTTIITPRTRQDVQKLTVVEDKISPRELLPGNNNESKIPHCSSRAYPSASKVQTVLPVRSSNNSNRRHVSGMRLQGSDIPPPVQISNENPKTQLPKKLASGIPSLSSSSTHRKLPISSTPAAHKSHRPITKTEDGKANIWNVTSTVLPTKERAMMVPPKSAPGVCINDENEHPIATTTNTTNSHSHIPCSSTTTAQKSSRYSYTMTTGGGQETRNNNKENHNNSLPSRTENLQTPAASGLLHVSTKETFFGIVETKSPCLIETSSDSDLEGGGFFKSRGAKSISSRYSNLSTSSSSTERSVVDLGTILLERSESSGSSGTGLVGITSIESPQLKDSYSLLDIPERHNEDWELISAKELAIERTSSQIAAEVLHEECSNYEELLREEIDFDSEDTMDEIPQQESDDSSFEVPVSTPIPTPVLVLEPERENSGQHAELVRMESIQRETLQQTQTKDQVTSEEILTVEEAVDPKPSHACCSIESSESIKSHNSSTMSLRASQGMPFAVSSMSLQVAKFLAQNTAVAKTDELKPTSTAEAPESSVRTTTTGELEKPSQADESLKKSIGIDPAEQCSRLEEKKQQTVSKSSLTTTTQPSRASHALERRPTELTEARTQTSSMLRVEGQGRKSAASSVTSTTTSMTTVNLNYGHFPSSCLSCHLALGNYRASTNTNKVEELKKCRTVYFNPDLLPRSSRQIDAHGKPLCLKRMTSAAELPDDCNHLVVDSTVSMYSVGSHLEGFLRIHNRSSKQICFRVTSLIPGRYQIIPSIGKLERNQNVALTVASVVPESFVKFEPDQFKIETIVAAPDVITPSEQRRLWNEISRDLIQETIVGRARIPYPSQLDLQEKKRQGMDTTISYGDGIVALPRETGPPVLESSQVPKQGVADICICTVIIGILAAAIHSYSSSINQI